MLKGGRPASQSSCTIKRTLQPPSWHSNPPPPRQGLETNPSKIPEGKVSSRKFRKIVLELGKRWSLSEAEHRKKTLQRSKQVHHTRQEKGPGPPGRKKVGEVEDSWCAQKTTQAFSSDRFIQTCGDGSQLQGDNPKRKMHAQEPVTKRLGSSLPQGSKARERKRIPSTNLRQNIPYHRRKELDNFASTLLGNSR